MRIIFSFFGIDKTYIISFANWQGITSLPMSNGILFIICEIIVRYVMKIGNSHQENTGCICDFLWDKRGIDACMRAAYICEDCRELSHENSYLQSREFEDLTNILDLISASSRQGIDMLSSLSKSPNLSKGNSQDPLFDVFICHNSKDKPKVRILNEFLKNKGVKTWFDEEQFSPGDLWQEKLEKAIVSIGACLIVVGDSGIGPWQDAEQRAFIGEFINRNCLVIPTIIGNSESIPDLPLFLKQFMWSDIRDGDETKISRIVKAIKKQ